MQPCNECHACSFPDKVTQAKTTIPAQWVAELIEEEAPDHIWIVALNLFTDIAEAGGPVPESVIQVWAGGQINEDDLAWTERQRYGMGISAAI